MSVVQHFLIQLKKNIPTELADHHSEQRQLLFTCSITISTNTKLHKEIKKSEVLIMILPIEKF